MGSAARAGGGGLRQWRHRSATVLVAMLCLAAAGCDWTMYRYGPEGTGYNPNEKTIGIDNVSQLQPAWTFETGERTRFSPVIAGGVAYVATYDADYSPPYVSSLRALDATTGTLLWSAPTAEGSWASPAVANGTVFVATARGQLQAFDAAGQAGCSGTPKTCLPLWTADMAWALPTSPVVANGAVYVGQSRCCDGPQLFAFDASGVNGCGGTPKVCQPLWTATERWTPLEAYQPSVSVGGGRVYLADRSSVSVFDEQAVEGCSGTPKVCTALWFGVPDGNGAPGPVYVGPAAFSSGVSYLASPGRVAAFDGATNCTTVGASRACWPIWTGALPSGSTSSSPAVANGLVYASTVGYGINAFDFGGPSGCTSGNCPARWTSPIQTRSSGLVVANGLVFATSSGGAATGVVAVDALGSTGCTGTPAVCSPVWAATVPGGVGDAAPVVLDGTLYLASASGSITAWRLPT